MKRHDLQPDQLLALLYRDDPVFYFEHGLGFLTWSGSRKIIESVKTHKKTAVRAGHSLSKSHTAAGIALWFYNNFFPSKVITTAPVFTQVSNILWPKINDAYRTANVQLIGEAQDVRVRDHESPEHLMIGFSTNLSARAEGHHEWNILYIFDEAKGIEEWMWDSAKGAMTGGFTRWLVISTTDGVKAGSPYHDCFREDSGWNQIHLSCYDSPYYTGESFRGIRYINGNPDDFETYEIEPKDAKIQIVNKEKIAEEEDPATGWGKGSPMFRSKMGGHLVDRQAGQIITISDIDQMYRNYENPDFVARGRLVAGIDVAWGGDADTTVWKRKGMKVEDYPLVITSEELPKTEIAQYMANRIHEYLNEKTGEDGYTINVDGSGVGAGLVSVLQGHGFIVNDIRFGGRAQESDKYVNFISEMWFNGAKIINQLACPRVARLTRELSARLQQGPQPDGRMQVESKKDFIRRGYPSPDFADAFLLMLVLYQVAFLGDGGGMAAY